jgi:hypothetical protein
MPGPGLLGTGAGQRRLHSALPAPRGTSVRRCAHRFQRGVAGLIVCGWLLASVLPKLMD